MQSNSCTHNHFFTFPVSYSVIDKRTGWFALSGKMPFLYIATQVNFNMLLCFFFLWTSEAYGTGEFSCPILFSAQISTHSSLQAAGGWAGRHYLWWIQLICKKNWIALGLFLYNLAVWIPGEWGTLRWSLTVKLHSVTLSDSRYLHRLKTVLLHGIEENPDPGDMT